MYFDGISGNGDGVGCAIDGRSASKDINVTISNCRFSNIKMTGKGSVLNIWELPKKDLVHLNLVSCTFADNDKASDGLICVVNAPHVHLLTMCSIIMEMVLLLILKVMMRQKTLFLMDIM